MKIVWWGYCLLLLAGGLMSAETLAETCTEYEPDPGPPSSFVFDSVQYFAIAAQDGFAYACLMDDLPNATPELWCFELGSTVSDQPTARSGIFLPTSSGRTVLTGGHAVMSMGSLGLGVVDISDPDHLTNFGLTATDDYCMSLDLLGADQLVTAEWSSLKIYNMQHPPLPVEIGAVTLSQARTVAVADDLAFVACGNLGLAIVDLSYPGFPSLVTQFPVGGFVDRVAADGNRVYLTGYQLGMVTVDVTNPLAPQVIDTLDLDGEPEEIFLRDGYAYLLVDHAVTVVPEMPDFDAMALVRLNPLGTPALVGNFFPRVSYSSLALGDDRVFLGEFDSQALLYQARLQCPDVSNVPDNPGLQISLSDPWPNPFNPRVSVRFNLTEGLPGRLNVFDLRGNLIAEIWRGVGTGRDENVVWNGTDRTGMTCPSGSYGFILSDQAGLQSTRVTGTLIR